MECEIKELKEERGSILGIMVKFMMESGRMIK